jgi:predicted phage tail protein
MSDQRLIAGGGGCFLGSTLVRTPSGQQRIDKIEPDDIVLSFDDRGVLHRGKVLKVHVHEGEQVVRYRLWGGTALDATPNHWVLNQFNAFVEIGALGPDDCLVDENGHLRPIVGSDDLGLGTVYNLTVEGRHTFIAGGIRVHNAGLGLGAVAGAGGGGGGGGKGGGARVPTEEGDNLNSSSVVEVIDLLGEGEIEGFATPSKAGHTRGSTEWNNAMLKDIYLNNTPILRSNASDAVPGPSDFSFKNLSIAPRYGTQSQSAMYSATGSGTAANEIGVGVVVEQAFPIARTITDVNVDAVRITLTVPQLQQVLDNGDIIGASINLIIEIQYGGSGFSIWVNDTITGRTSDAYQRDYLLTLGGASFPVDIRITRYTDDSTSARLSNAFSWTSYTEIIAEKLRYPNSALVKMRASAEQFSNVPSRSYQVRGLKVKIPSNATVDRANGRLIYSGTWDGTFGSAQWTSDPAWCLWNLLTNKRYGFGDHIVGANLDKWSFFSASQYASELVPTGFGGTEPRFSMNCLIQTQEEAYKLINDLCSVFRVMPYWATGALSIAQDKPADSSYLFTLANVTEEGFSYAGSDTKVRPTVAIVSYLDLRTREIAYEVSEDAAAIAKYGVQTTEVAAFACTSRGQAARLGDWILYSSQYETEIVSFTVSIDAGVIVRPGSIIQIADPARGGARRGGRIAAATSTQITVDSAVDLPGSGGTLAVILKDGTVESRSVSSRSGTVITVSEAFSAAPGVNSVWLYSGGGVQPTLWRVLTIKEVEGVSYEIAALSYNSSKYGYIERDRPLQSRDVTNLNELPAAPTNLSITETLYSYQGQVRAKVIIAWRPKSGVYQYQVRWRKNSANWSNYTTQSPDHEILNITPGTFEVEVFSISASGKTSTSSLTGTINALGKTAPPSNVTGFTHVIDPDIGIQLGWNPVTDLDLRDYEIRQGGTDWETAAFVARVAATTYKVGILEAGVVTYRIKARDTSNVYSAADATRTVTITAAAAPSVTHAIEDPVVALSWSTPRGSYSAAYYDLRYGANWESGIKIAEVRANSFNVTVTWSGAQTFWVAAVDPVGTTGAAGSRVVTINAAAAPSISAAFYGRSCTLTWNAVTGTLGTRFYEISYGETYAGRTIITRISSDGTGYSLPADWSGARTFYVAAVDGNGNLGNAGSVATNITPAPAPSLSTLIIGQYAQISWTPVRGTLETAYYEVRRGSDWLSSPVVGRVNSTAIEVKADWVGTQRFLVRAVDINGLYGATGG